VSPSAPRTAVDKSGAAEVEKMLRAAQMRMDPNSEIRAAVERCDELLDANPRDKSVWLTLARALAIGFARSKHAATPLEARRRAAALAPDDCHLAGLVIRGELADGKSALLDVWRDRAGDCAEIPFLASRVKGASSELELLGQSRRLGPSAEGLVALGAAELRRGHLQEALEAYRAALDAPPLFPEDWRMDGWIAVHANLGLALVYTKLHQPPKARAAWKAANTYLADPGPWHDLSDEERRWASQVLHRDVR